MYSNAYRQWAPRQFVTEGTQRNGADGDTFKDFGDQTKRTTETSRSFLRKTKVNTEYILANSDNFLVLRIIT
jgi:hypothetical protein